MEGKFRFAKSNRIYAGTVVLLGLVWFVMFSEKSAYQTGQFFGWLLFALLLPLALAWIVWRISGRKKNGGTVTFNVVLTLWLLGQAASLGSNLIQAREVVRMLQDQDAVKRKMAESDDPDEVAVAYDDLVNSSEAAAAP